MFNSGTSHTTMMLLLVLFALNGLSKAQTAADSSGRGNLPPADTLRLSNMLQDIGVLAGMEETAENTQWLNTLKKELLNSARSPFEFEFIALKAGKLGTKNRNQYRMQEAAFWHQLEFDAASLGQLTSLQIRALNNIGLIYRRTDKYEAAIEAYQQAIKLAETSGETEGIVYALNGLGNIYLELGNLDEAMLNFRECLRQEQAANNLTGIAINLNNIGHVYREKGELERAMEYFMLSLEVNQEIPSQRGIAICYNDIGEIYKLRGDNEKALSYFELSLNLNRLIGELYYLGINHLKVAEILFEKQSFGSLQNHIDEAIRLSKLTNNRSNLMKSYRIKYEIERRQGKIADAIEYLEKAWVLNDSILNENLQRKVLQLQATFNRERANNQIALLQNEKMLAELRLSRQKDYTLIVVAGLVIMIIGTGLLIYLLISKNRAVNELRLKNREVEQARLQLAEYNQQLLNAKQEAEQSNRLKSQFLANMSHEIRTPLNSVIGFADLLSEKIGDPVKLSYLESIRSSGRSLLMLIEDILDLSKIEAGKFKPELHSMSMNNLFLEIRRIFELQAFQKNILLKFDIADDFPEIILMHEGSLRQIFVNLVGNALKFTESGQITISAEVLARQGDFYDLKLSVGDTGPGIAPEDLDHIFDAFYQSQSNAGQQKGTGLGLTITKRLVELLNGTITAASVQGVGTTFDIVFKGVKSIALRTALRLASSDRQSSPIAMLTQDNTILAQVDGILTELGVTCDLYDDPVEFGRQLGTTAYRIALLDTKMSDEANFHATDELIGEHLQLYLASDGRATAPQGHELFILPEQLKKLKSTLEKTLFGSRSSKDENDAFVILTDGLSEEENELLSAYQKATESQLVQDIVDFAIMLSRYGERHHEKQLVKMGKDLEQTARAIDIDMMNTLMAEFGKRLKTEQKSL